MKRIISSICFVIIIQTLFSQTLFSKRYGSGTLEQGYAITPTHDNGFAVIGTTQENGASGDIFIMKLDYQGVIQWQKDIFGVGEDIATSVLQIANGNFVVCGQTYSYGSGCWDALLVMMDSTGNILWSNAYGDVECQAVASCTQTQDGGYIIAGTASGTTSYGSLTKIDHNGNFQWAKSYSASNYFMSAKQTSDGGYIAVSEYPFLIYKTDSIGNILWCQHYLSGTAGSGNTHSYDIETFEDGSSVITGEIYFNAYGGEPDVFLLKIDNLGNRIWFKTYGFTFFEYGLDVKQTADLGYIIAGRTNSFGHGGNDALLIKTDMNGDLAWAKTYGDVWEDEALQVKVLNDGFVFVGNSYTATNSQADSNYVYVVRTDLNGVTNCHYMDWTPLEQTQTYNPISQTVTTTSFGTDSLALPTSTNLHFLQRDFCALLGITEYNYNSEITISPNPFTSQTTISFSQEQTNTTIKITDILGKEIKAINFSGKQCTIEKGTMQAGIYFVQITTSASSVNEKVVNRKVVVQ